MQVNLSGHHVDDHPGPAQLRREEARRASLRHFDHVIDVHCIADGREAAAQGRVDAARCAARRSTPPPIDDDMYAAIDALADKLERRVRKHKEKHRDPRGRTDEPRPDARPNGDARRSAVRARWTPMRLIIVSGLSGSGKSVALDMLEDLDFYCVDNIPAALLPGFIAYTVRTSEPVVPRYGGRRRRAQPPRGPRGRAAAGRGRCARSGIDCETAVPARRQRRRCCKRFSETRRTPSAEPRRHRPAGSARAGTAAARAARQRRRPHDRHLAPVGARTARADPGARRRARGDRAVAAVRVVRLSARRAGRRGLRVRRARAAEPVLGPGAARSDRA